MFSSGCFGESSLTIAPRPGAALQNAIAAPGKTQLRLLNADEYRNTVRDLLMGVPAAGFADDQGCGPVPGL